MNDRKRIAIIGATSAMAEHCARLWVEKSSVEMILVGRNAQRTERVAADLRVRSPASQISVMESDFLDPDRIKATVDRITAQGSVDIVLIAHGTLPEQADCQTNLSLCRNTLEINGISPVLFAEAFAGIMEKANHGTLAIIGSVAGDRGRKKNYTYGSAKGLVDRYTQGLQHRLAKTKVNIVLLKPGPTETPMTAKLMSDTLKASPVALVSQQIVNAIEKKRLVAYIPFKWRIIMWTIKHIPVNIFNKLDI